MGHSHSKMKRTEERDEEVYSSPTSTSNIPEILDPRSPSANIVRTPIPVAVASSTCTTPIIGHINTDILVEATESIDSIYLDPRSPSVEFTRTPITVISQTKLRNKRLELVRKEMAFTPVKSDCEDRLDTVTIEEDAAEVNISTSDLCISDSSNTDTNTKTQSSQDKDNNSEEAASKFQECVLSKTVYDSIKMEHSAKEKHDIKMVENDTSTNNNHTGSTKDDLPDTSSKRENETKSTYDKFKQNVSVDNKVSDIVVRKPKLLGVISISKTSATDTKRQSTTGLLETNLDYVETNIDEIQNHEPDKPKSEEEHTGKKVGNTYIINTKEFNNKVTNLIYEDTKRINPEKPINVGNNGRNVLSERNGCEKIPRVNKLKVRDYPALPKHEKLSKIPILKKNTKQCENTPPKNVNMKKRSEWDGDATLII